MNYVLIGGLYALILGFDWISIRGATERKEKMLYLIFGILALLSALPAAYWMRLDHAGASLSGMLSQFIS